MIFSHNSHKTGFTLIETLLAISLFAVVVTLTATVLMTVVNADKKTEIRNTLYDDARMLMDQIAGEIQYNAVDYDEYYSFNVIQKNWTNKLFGIYHGVYGSRFFHPGEKSNYTDGDNPADLGVFCSVPEDATNPPYDCSIVYTPSQDSSTGKNPYAGKSGGYSEGDANAFCDQVLGGSNCSSFIPESGLLFLIDEKGLTKTIIATQKITADQNAVAILKMNGLDSDQNGISDIFSCEEKNACAAYSNVLFEDSKDLEPIAFPNITTILAENPPTLAQSSTLATNYNINTSPFVPISQLSNNVTELKFRINPIEDPYKGYAEANRTQPTVTIFLTMEPSPEQKLRYPGTNKPQLTLQRTVTAGVTTKVESYPPTNSLEWINNLL